MSDIDVRKIYTKSETLGDCLRLAYSDVASMPSKSIVISKKNVLRRSNAKARDVLYRLLELLVKPGSGICNFSRIAELYALAQQGHSCLIMLEHYSNFDLPCLMYLLDDIGQRGRAIHESTIAMAAMKLNEENPLISVYADAFSHLSIFPARRLDELSVVAHDHSELKKAREINMMSLKLMRSLSHSGHIILLFPSGTRYKPGEPHTKLVVKAADSFLKRFDYVLFGGIAGNTLIVNNPADMLSDYINSDFMVYSFSKVHKCKSFRKEAKNAMQAEDDQLYQLVIERIQDELDAAHTIAQQRYDQLSTAENS